ncbi:hypothetical protein ANN_03342 [Periplaneta americana]|uniref:Uncharacterized protein n=1 Tax=Periplaneta americana TaxID=6978 RepID=A0ABQ8U2U3_PERAM|nr:hypothetical protein ANN_03342 [Periplaneta americana]
MTGRGTRKPCRVEANDIRIIRGTEFRGGILRRYIIFFEWTVYILRCALLFIFLEEAVLPSARTSRSLSVPTDNITVITIVPLRLIPLRLSPGWSTVHTSKQIVTSPLFCAHLNAIDLARDRTRNFGHRRPALYQLANQVDLHDGECNMNGRNSLPCKTYFVRDRAYLLVFRTEPIRDFRLQIIEPELLVKIVTMQHHALRLQNHSVNVTPYRTCGSSDFSTGHTSAIQLDQDKSASGDNRMECRGM